MSANVHCLLYQTVDILGNLGSTSILLKETDDLLTSEELNAGNSFLISDSNTDLGRRHALLGHSNDEITDGSGSVCDPTGGSSFEWSDSRADTLSLSFRLYSAHLVHNINLIFY
jgi:hypothetical protein